MKKILATTIAVALTGYLIAQVPQKMSYQAVVRNPDGALLASQNIGIRIQILQSSEFGAAVFVETHTSHTNANGLVTLEIGTGNVVFGTFSDINWSSGPYFLKSEIDPAGGTSYSIIGTSQLLSVPYALQAKNVTSYNETDPVFSASPSNGINSGNISDWNSAYGWGNHATAGYVSNTRTLTINGTAQDLSSNRIWSVGTVTSINLTMPAMFSVSGSPITGTGTLSASLASQSANLIFASPNGSSGTPTFRSLSSTDIPNLSWGKITSGKPTTLIGYGITDGVNTTSNQTIAGNKTFSGTTTVQPPVNATDAATKEYIDNLLKAFDISLPANFAGTISDIDGNTYRTVTIGNQTWMAENLRTGRMNDGYGIFEMTNAAGWWTYFSPAYGFYNNDVSSVSLYGYLYNWYAVNRGNLCPTGWHVPTDSEWSTLSTYLGGENLAGGKLKETGTAHWSSPNSGATNETGFTALPGGANQAGSYSNLSHFGYWWSSTEYSSTDAAGPRAIPNYNYYLVRQNNIDKRYGYSVRCLKD